MQQLIDGVASQLVKLTPFCTVLGLSIQKIRNRKLFNINIQDVSADCVSFRSYFRLFHFESTRNLSRHSLNVLLF